MSEPQHTQPDFTLKPNQHTSMHTSIEGLSCAMLTPVSPQGQVIDALFAQHAQALLRQGCDQIVPFGTTGESLSFSPAQRMRALEALMGAGVPPHQVVVGTGATNLEETIALNRHALELGCAAALLMPPNFFSQVNEHSLYRYFKTVIGACSGLRFFIYHFPAVFGFAIPPTLMLRLTRDFPDQVIGMKDSSGQYDYLLQLLRSGVRANLQPGNELIWQPYQQLLNARGIITATANLIPTTLKRYLQAPDAISLKKMAELRAAIGGNLVGHMKAQLAHALNEPAWLQTMPPLCQVESTQQSPLPLNIEVGY